MYSGLVPAISLEDEDGKKKKDVDDYSEYFFWMFRPDAKEHSSKKGEPESFRDDTLLVWLNGKMIVFPVVLIMLGAYALFSITLYYRWTRLQFHGWADGRKWPCYNSQM